MRALRETSALRPPWKECVAWFSSKILRKTSAKVLTTFECNIFSPQGAATILSTTPPLQVMPGTLAALGVASRRWRKWPAFGAPNFTTIAHVTRSCPGSNRRKLLKRRLIESIDAVIVESPKGLDCQTVRILAMQIWACSQLPAQRHHTLGKPPVGSRSTPQSCRLKPGNMHRGFPPLGIDHGHACAAESIGSANAMATQQKTHIKKGPPQTSMTSSASRWWV